MREVLGRPGTLTAHGFRHACKCLLTLNGSDISAMTYLSQAAANPTIISQYGPVVAAFVALFGVFTALAVNVSRDRERYRSQREDDYRRDQRIAIAAIAVAGHNFRRECGMLVDPDNWSPQRRRLADAAMGALLNELTVARLLIHDATLQGALDDVNNAWRATAKALDEMEDASAGREQRRQAAESVTDAMRQFDAAANVLYTAALEKLKPTIVQVR
jgi:hypothetical protein